MASGKINLRNTDVMARGEGPEDTKYDKRRHETMRLRQNGMYGIPKFFLDFDTRPMMACEKCVFDTGTHNCGR